MSKQRGKLVRPGSRAVPRHSWKAELGWYRQNFHGFLHMSLLGPILIIKLTAPYVIARQNTVIMAIAWGVIGGFSITIGYHRLWAHRSFSACLGIRIALAVVGAAQNQWPILWWAKHHRAHHKYTDTDQDPYNATRGLLFSHIGWLLGLNENAWGPVDVSDLKKDPVVIWQDRLYWPILITVGILLPGTIAHYGWNDWKGGILYAGLTRIIVTQHFTFLINSVAHAPWAGTQPYSTGTTARNNPFLAILTLGEANHNFHHAFPADYRNGVSWNEPDFSRWIIWLWGKLGWANDLKIASPLEIERARSNQLKGRPQRQRDSLPLMSWKDFRKRSDDAHNLICIDGGIYDVADFMDAHPGGRDMIQQSLGKDATDLYHGSHLHSSHADNILRALQVFTLEDSRH
ncbi:Acyl-CoA desaturase [Penicillium brasilianum]|uniref:Acyl-CoA desaturase n=1 Tax=Penicillium brasilianum TaxID=104259 RepID=A0A1S9RFN9_PENBI|nr:Acyl-CoA desaturase [Penicillium brasilianum]